MCISKVGEKQHFAHIDHRIDMLHARQLEEKSLKEVSRNWKVSRVLVGLSISQPWAGKVVISVTVFMEHVD